MREWILGGIIALLLMTQPSLADKRFDENQRLAYVAFVHGCQVSSYNCDGLETPQVRESSQITHMTLRGLYQGGTILWVRPGMGSTRQMLTIFHEVIHYLQFQAGKPDVSSTVRCLLEFEAFELTNLYVDLIGYGDEFKRELDEWRISYRC